MSKFIAAVVLSSVLVSFASAAEKIEGSASGDSRWSGKRENAFALSLLADPKTGKVQGLLENCRSYVHDYPPACADSIRFDFPRLSADAKTRTVLLDGKTVGKFHPATRVVRLTGAKLGHALADGRAVMHLQTTGAE